MTSTRPARTIDESGQQAPALSVDEVELQLRQEREKNLNALDALIGARAALSQSQQDTKDALYLLDLRESELNKIKAALGFDLETHFEEVALAIDRLKEQSDVGQSEKRQSDSLDRATEEIQVKGISLGSPLDRLRDRRKDLRRKLTDRLAGGGSFGDEQN